MAAGPTSECFPRTDVDGPVDRLVRDLHRAVVREVEPERGRDLLRGPVQLETLQHRIPQRWVRFQPGRLRLSGPSGCRNIGTNRAVASSSAVASDLLRHRGRRPPKVPRDRPRGQPRCDPSRDLLPLNSGQMQPMPHPLRRPDTAMPDQEAAHLLPLQANVTSDQAQRLTPPPAIPDQPLLLHRELHPDLRRSSSTRGVIGRPVETAIVC